MGGLTLDAGFLIAIERDDRRANALLRRARVRGDRLAVPAGVIGQVWRDGRRQARLVALLGAADVEVVTLDAREARSAGVLCGATRTADVIDASVVLCAREREHAIITSDPDDLRRLDQTVRLLVV